MENTKKYYEDKINDIDPMENGSTLSLRIMQNDYWQDLTLLSNYLAKKKLIDMHIHSIYSDGEYDIEKLIRLALEVGLKAMAITDHNTIEGIKTLDRINSIFSPIPALIKDTNLKIIKGIELTAKVKQGQMHILGYDLNPYNKELNQKMAMLKDNSVNRLLSIYEQIKRDYGITFTYEDIKTLINANHNLGRPDIAKLCVKYGYAENVPDAFNKYLNAAHEKIRGVNKGLTAEECISLIKTSGGIPVLAHPKSLKLEDTEFQKKLQELISYGLQGIEAYHSSFTTADQQYYLAMAKKYNLLISGGSDYHGPTVKPDISMGLGKNNLLIRKLSLLDKINSKNI